MKINKKEKNNFKKTIACGATIIGLAITFAALGTKTGKMENSKIEYEIDDLDPNEQDIEKAVKKLEELGATEVSYKDFFLDEYVENPNVSIENDTEKQEQPVIAIRITDNQAKQVTINYGYSMHNLDRLQKDGENYDLTDNQELEYIYCNPTKQELISHITKKIAFGTVSIAQENGYNSAMTDEEIELQKTAIVSAIYQFSIYNNISLDEAIENISNMIEPKTFVKELVENYSDVALMILQDPQNLSDYFVSTEAINYFLKYYQIKEDFAACQYKFEKEDYAEEFWTCVREDFHLDKDTEVLQGNNEPYKSSVIHFINQMYSWTTEMNIDSLTKEEIQKVNQCNSFLNINPIDTVYKNNPTNIDINSITTKKEKTIKL